MKTHPKQGNYEAIIVGGGPAGLTASYILSKEGVRSLVLEKGPQLGGLSKTVNYKNFLFDIGGHRFFTKNRRVEEIWHELLGNDFLVRKRLSRIYYKKKFFYYPLRALNALFGLGIINSLLILISYLHIRLAPLPHEKSFEQWISNRFGKRLFNIFFKTYTEKVWGMPCSEIRAEWAAQRIKGLSLMAVIQNTLSSFPRMPSNKKTVIKTLIGEFHYPKLGPGMMWETVGEKIRENNSQILLNSEVEEIRWSQHRIEAVKIRRNGEVEEICGKQFINSMPIRDTIQRFKPAAPIEIIQAANDLKYRDFLTVALIVNKADIFPDNWIYIHDPDVKVGRIQNYKNWSPYMVPSQDKTCLGLEYFCFEGDSLWTTSDEKLIESAKSELQLLGLVDGTDVEEGTVVRMAKAYPIYDSTYRNSLQTVRKFLDRFDNFRMIGRNGLHKYNNQDHSMLTGIIAAENILGKTKDDPWVVNEDQEFHEEITDHVLSQIFARIDKLGLGMALGSVSGLIIFFATIITLMKGNVVLAKNLQLLDQYFIGYSVTLKGAFIGMFYGFGWGFLFAWLFAYLRNLFVAIYLFRIKRRSERMTFWDLMDNF
jgi:protoporphyrinogen oxidase